MGNSKEQCAAAGTALIIAAWTLPLYGNAADSGNNLTTVELALEQRHFRFREYDNGQRLNRESGTLVGSSLGIDWRRDDWSLFASLGYAGGETDHYGQTQLGDPVETTTDQALQRFELGMKRRFQLAPGLYLSGIIALGQIERERDIASTAAAVGVIEKYRWRYLSPGMQLDIDLGNRSKLQLAGLRHYTRHENVRVNFKNDFDSASVHPRADDSWEWQASFHYRLAPGWELALSGAQQQWRFKRSPPASLRRRGNLIGQLFQPAHKMRSESVSIGLRYQL